MVRTRLKLILFLLVLVVTGCTNVDIKHVINADGSSSIEVLTDYEPFVKILHAHAEETGQETKDDGLDGLCESYDFNHYGLQNVECIVIEKYKVMIRGDYPAGSLELEEINGMFSYKVKSVYPLIGFTILPTSYSVTSSLGDEESTQTETQNPIFDDEYLEEIIEGNKELLEQSDILIDPVYHSYEVIMPGQVISADVGTIDGNKIFIDMFALPAVNDPVIMYSLESQAEQETTTQNDLTGTPQDLHETETSTTGSAPPSDEIQATASSNTAIIYGLIGLISVIAISFILYYLTKKKEGYPERKLGDPDNYLYKKSQAPIDNYTVNQLVEWIHTYEKKFPDSMLKDVLRKHGHSKENIEEAFRRR